MKDYFIDTLPLQGFHITKDKNYCEIVAIILSLDSYSFNLFYDTETLKKIFASFFRQSLTFKQIKQAQLSVLKDLSANTTKDTLKEISQNLVFLKENELLNQEHFNILESFLQGIEQKINTDNALKEDSKFLESFKGDFFNQAMSFLQEEKEFLQTCDESIKNHLEEFLENAKVQKYSLGVTGVLSAGKSTFLNALLQKEILGSSSIPETASLTILKYAKESYGEITFWNKIEWEELQKYREEESLEKLFSLKDFKENVEKYIKEESFNLKIKIEDLGKYTSANDESKICNLVKKTTLFMPLEFLKNNVEIVDTPGLDDPIIQREEITKGYVKQCDLLIHCMNASQSATQIDIDFILETLRVSNLSRILILLTHKDLLSENELLDALNYTKDSIKNQLFKEMQSKEAELLLERLDFIAIAGYEALLCKVNPQKAKELGFSYENSNFQSFLDYLDSTLLGKNSKKTKDIIFGALQGFLRVAKRIYERNELKEKLLFKSQDEIQILILQAQKEKEKIQKEFMESTQKINAIEVELKEYLETLQGFLLMQLKEAQDVLTQRVFDDICYDFEKGKSASLERIDGIISQGLKDYLIDILRQFRQKLDKKILQIKAKLQEENENLGANFAYGVNEKMLIKTKMLILAKLSKILKSYGKSQKNALKEAINATFLESFSLFSENIFKESKVLESAIVNAFQKKIEGVYAELEEKGKENKRILESALAQNSIGKENKEKEQMRLNAQNASLAQMIGRLEALKRFIGAKNA